MDAKYLIINRDNGLKSVYLFSEHDQHESLVRAFGLTAEQIHSAGFVRKSDSGYMIATGGVAGVGQTQSDSSAIINAHLTID